MKGPAELPDKEALSVQRMRDTHRRRSKERQDRELSLPRHLRHRLPPPPPSSPILLLLAALITLTQMERLLREEDEDI